MTDDLDRKENSMPAPLIFATTARIKEGKLDDYRRFITELVEQVMAKEPRIIAFNVYLNEQGTEMTSIQVHPDAASMDLHLQLLPQLLGDSMSQWIGRADFLQIKHIDIYGTPSAAVLDADQQWVDSGAFSRAVKPLHLAGFTRASTGGARS
jgi:quinol monooxygenase YgiN